MKITKRVLSIVMAIITLVSVMGIAAEAANVSVNELNLGYMAPANSKVTKLLSTVRLYGEYDYINFYIESNKANTYFVYVITTDEEGEDVVATNAVLCDKGTYTYTEKIKLKGDYVSGTYYIFTYAMKTYSDDSIKIDQNSMCQFKLVVKRTASFDNKIVVLKEAKNTTKGVNVSWSKLSGASKYYIYRRSLMGTKWTKVGAVGSSKTSFTDTTAKNTGKYVYSVKAINKSGTASRYLYSGLTCIFAKAPTMKSVTVTANNTIEIKWNSTSSKAKYNIMRKSDDGSWKTIKTNYSGTTYKDTSVKSGTKYTYTVKAVISTDYGDAISSYYYNSDKAVTYLRMPTLKETAAVENGVNVSWYDVSGAKGYTILRKNSDGSTGWSSVGKVDADATSFVDTSADIETGYIYSVRSEASKNKGSYNSKGIEYIYVAPVAPDTTEPVTDSE
ncbi:MAG: fibronectin type III domain-containing protein [Clostridia bacterium]|nr:fibronectin type III domain-containing protein [Clostridia bacterium]